MAATAVANAAPGETCDLLEETEPPWVQELASREGVTQPAAHNYWADTSSPQPHGPCTVIALLHEGTLGSRAVRPPGGRVFLEPATRTVYGVWPLGARVCGHPGLVHGGVTALLLDEMFGQAYWAFTFGERGPGFTANLNVDYKAPVPAGSWLCITVRETGVEGRKVRLAATVADGPSSDAKVYAAASCLFVVARKD